MPQRSENFERKKGLAIFLSLVMLAMTAGYAFFAAEFIQQLSSLDVQAFYLRLSMMVIPGLIASPIFLLSIYIMLRRHFGHLPERHFALWVKVSLLLLALAFIVRITSGFWLPGYVAAHGFTHCSKLENPSPFASQVWVRQPQYCHELSYLVNVEVLEWFDEQQAAGAKPSNDEVIAQIELLIAEHKQRYQ
ncbi:hypothetical protein [Rheinheimera baltica]|uniref:hypothetical protein n=1 Tax=Rheinheimera baltica TaxID=67576 RepID=UPI00273E3553|nr:hypothetical protein [Rheinheimera baltica]MDP5188385.1 hypothetical protein [Rheinheimera baltica]